GVACVDLLVRNVRRHVDEIAGAGLGGELEPVAPSHPRAAADDVDDALDRSVMMRAGLRLRMDDHRAGPQLLGAHARVVDGRRPAHPRRLRGIAVELVGPHDAHAVVTPFRFGWHCALLTLAAPDSLRLRAGDYKPEAQA